MDRPFLCAARLHEERESRYIGCSEALFLVIVHILIGVVQAILRAMTSAFLLFFSSLFTTLIVLALLSLATFGLSGYVGLRLSRRNRSPRA